jgi:hypothetical protein
MRNDLIISVIVVICSLQLQAQPAFATEPYPVHTAAVVTVSGKNNNDEAASWQAGGHVACTTSPYMMGATLYAFEGHTATSCGITYCTSQSPAQAGYLRIHVLSGAGDQVDNGKHVTLYYNSRVYWGSTYQEKGALQLTVYKDGTTIERSWSPPGGVKTGTATYHVGTWQSGGYSDWASVTASGAF